jgi:hypothetical protein
LCFPPFLPGGSEVGFDPNNDDDDDDVNDVNDDNDDMDGIHEVHDIIFDTENNDVNVYAEGCVSRVS